MARTARILDNVRELSAEDWDRCANPGGEVPTNPFLGHAFLDALEQSQSATPRTGWQPFHVVLEAGRPDAPIPGPTPSPIDPVSFEATVRLDTPNEVRYFVNGGILQTVLRDLNES